MTISSWTFKRFCILTLMSVSVIGLWSCDDDHDHDHDEEHFEAVGLVLTSGGTEVLRLEDGEITGSVNIPLGMEGQTFDVEFILEDGDLAKPDEDLELLIEVVDGAVVEASEVNSTDYTFHLRGLAAGSTTFRVSLLHEGHSDYVSLQLPVVINM